MGTIRRQGDKHPGLSRAVENILLVINWVGDVQRCGGQGSRITLLREPIEQSN